MSVTATHPRLDDNGQKVILQYPSKPSAASAWSDPAGIATVIPDGEVPATLNGIPMAPWRAPDADAGWNAITGRNPTIDEPPAPIASKVAAGAIVIEPDGRVWVTSPSNNFGGYLHTFPKGTCENLDLQGTAIKEVFEETGFKIKLEDFVADSVRSTSVTRYYLARRVAGTPAAMGWESQAVNLVPMAELEAFVDKEVDKALARDLVKRIKTKRLTA